MKLPPWTYSQLESFETCPRKHYEVSVARNIPYVQGEEAKWGDSVHKALELRVANGTPLPTGMTQWEAFANSLVKKPGEKIVEGKFAIDKDFKACNYYASDAWSRGKIDLTIITDTTAAVIDYKTGKRKLTEQLQLYAGYIFPAYPKVQKVHTAFAWLKDQKLDKDVITREEMPVIWQNFVARSRRLEKAYEKNEWQPRPSGLCKKHCPVKTCEFNGV